MKVFQKWVQCLLNKEDSDWKEQLNRYEVSKNWACAIKLMKKIIRKNPNDIDPYLFMCYLLMNILVEEDYDVKKHDWYVNLLKKYYFDSYSKFNQNPEYLFYISKIAYMSEWYLDLDIKDVREIMKKALKLEPENPLYQWASFVGLAMRDFDSREKVIFFSKDAISNPIILDMLKSKGALGNHILDGFKFWVKEEGKLVF